DAPPTSLADSTDTWAALERSEQVALVERALAALSAEKREAFVLKHVEGMSYEEMAAVTGARIPTLKMRVHRAREALLATPAEVGACARRRLDRDSAAAVGNVGFPAAGRG